MDNRKDFRVIVYDSFFNDYRWNTESFFETEEQATDYAVELCDTVDPYTDEVQLYERGLGMGEWCLIAYVEMDENEDIFIEYCVC